MTLAPWDYLFLSFSSRNFPDLFNPTWIAALVLLVVLLVLYNRRTKALHRHQPYVDLWEWLWWTGLITFSMVVISTLPCEGAVHDGHHGLHPRRTARDDRVQ